MGRRRSAEEMLVAFPDLVDSMADLLFEIDGEVLGPHTCRLLKRMCERHRREQKESVDGGT